VDENFPNYFFISKIFRIKYNDIASSQVECTGNGRKIWQIYQILNTAIGSHYYNRRIKISVIDIF
jgi:hypothetical protein